jgi:beta-1,4-mannosyl-glycoprotein beta-1,4-N-acetylglucosaminyltransferase
MLTPHGHLGSCSFGVWASKLVQRRIVSFVALFCMIGVYIIVQAVSTSQDHSFSRAALIQPSALISGSHTPASLQDLHDACRAHGFVPWNIREQERKVYDLTLMSNELDWLEIRLHTLSAYVDYFVIIESPTTFTGKPKPLHLKDNWERFAAFHDKIIYHEVQDIVNSQRVWDHEDFLRDALLKAVFPTLVGTSAEAHYGDILVVNDMDEIARPETMVLLRSCQFPSRLTLASDFYYYSFQWRHQGQQWMGPHATIYRGSATISPNNLRQGLLEDGLRPITAFYRWRDRRTLWNAGWHCSSCFVTVEEILMKMGAFSHKPLNTAENRNPLTILDRVRNGLDLFGRTDQLFTRVENNTDVPFYILQEHRREGVRFDYLLNRDGEKAGFEDA